MEMEFTFNFRNGVPTSDRQIWPFYLERRLEKTCQNYLDKGVPESKLKAVLREFSKVAIDVTTEMLLDNAEYQGFRCAVLSQPAMVVGKTCSLYARRTAESIRNGRIKRNELVDFFNGYDMMCGNKDISALVKTESALQICPEDYQTIRRIVIGD